MTAARPRPVRPGYVRYVRSLLLRFRNFIKRRAAEVEAIRANKPFPPLDEVPK